MKRSTNTRLLSIFMSVIMILTMITGSGMSMSVKAEQRDEDTVISQEDTEEVTTEEVTTEEVTTENISEETSEDSSEDVVDEETEVTTEETEDEYHLTIDPNGTKDLTKTWAEAEDIMDGPELASVDIDETVWKDASSYLTQHIIKVGTTTVKDGDTVDPASDFMLTLQFRMEQDDMVANGLQYYYRLPEHVSIGAIGSKTNQVTLYNSMRVAIGTYYVEDDVMYITFPGYYENVVCNFSQGASWSEVENLTAIPVDWGTNKEVFLLDNCDLKIIKNATGYKSDDQGNLYNSYKITVKPKTSGASINNITFKDVFVTKYLKWKEDEYGTNKDIKLTQYSADGEILSEKYYSIDDVTVYNSTSNGNKYTTTITPVEITAGGYFTVEYTAICMAKDRMEWECKNGKESYTNKAEASYPFYNVTLGKTETVSVKTDINGTYSSDGSWVLKSASDKTKTTSMNGDTKTIVPYTIQVNKNRFYSLGGSIVNDAITGFGDGNVKKDVVYDTRATANCYVVAIDKKGERNIDQSWVIVDESLFNQLMGLKGGKKTQIEALRSNTSLQTALINAINTAKGTSYTSFTDEVAMQYVFTTEKGHEFVWVTPLDEVPTTYIIHYDTIVDSEVGSFSNSASLWYTEYDAVPPGGYGIGWSRPVKKVLNASKTNYGVYQDAEGRYLVDYTLTVGLEAGSAGFNDIMIVDYMPAHDAYVNGEKTKVYDWLYMEGNPQIDLGDCNHKDSYDVTELLTNSFITSCTTTSTDPAVQKVAADVEAYIGSIGRAVNRSLGSYKGDGKVSSSYNTYNASEIYTGDNVDAGQYMCTGIYRDKTNVVYNAGDSYSFKRVSFAIGNLPATEEGYTIEINYTLQVNPCLIESLPQLIEESSDDYITNTNKMGVNTSYKEGDKYSWCDGNISNSGTIAIKSTSYWIGKSDPTPVIDKDVVEYHKDTRILDYKVDINNLQNAPGMKTTYILEDNLNISGLKYKEKSLTLYDKNGAIVYTNVAGKTAATKYKNIATMEMTKSDTETNGFKITLDNSSDVLSDGSKLIYMYMTYSVDFTDADSDVVLMNTVGLSMKAYDEEDNVYYDELLGQDVSEYTVDKALQKGLISAPNAGNNYSPTFYILVDPTSDNAYQLKNIKAGDSVKVKDTLGSNMRLDLDSVKVYQILDGAKTDITANAKKTYNTKTNEFNVDIPVSNKNAKYRVEYNTTILNNEAGKVHYTNTAIVEGTDIKEELLKEVAYVPKNNEDAEALTSNIQFEKFDAYDIEKHVNATYDLYYYNTTNKKWEILTGEGSYYDQITTGSDGMVTIKNPAVVSSSPVRLVQRGIWYKLVEVAAEDGYMVDSTPTYYYVLDENEINPAEDSIPKDVEESTYTPVNLVVQGAVYPILQAGDHTLSFDLSKVDLGSREGIANVPFTLYKDAACTQVIKAAKTDQDGKIEFNDLGLPLDTTLYIKELETPAGYLEQSGVFAITFDQGFIKTVTYTDADGTTDVSKNASSTTERSTLTVTNKKPTGDLLITKTVTATTPEALNGEFNFKIQIKDTNGNVVTKKYDAILTDADGNETAKKIQSDVMFTLKNGQSILIKEIEKDYTYTVSEVKSGDYMTFIKVTDNAGNDSLSRREILEASGTVEQGSRDQIDFENVAYQMLRIKKYTVNVEDEEATIEIPDGMQILFSEYSSFSGSFVVEYNADTKLWKKVSNASSAFKDAEVINEEDGTFTIRGIKASSRMYFKEVNHNIEGYGCELKYAQTTAGFTTPTNTAGNFCTTYFSSTSTAPRYITMENRYTNNSASVELKTKKTLENATLKKDQFSFKVERATKTDSGIGIYNLTQYVTNDAKGNISYKDNYSSSNLGDDSSVTYIYKITEVYPTYAHQREPGVTYDIASVYKLVTVSVDDGGRIQATTPVTCDSEGNPSADGKEEFVNIYNANGSIEIPFTKEQKTMSAAASKYSFTLEEYDATYTNPVLDASGYPVKYTKKITTSISAGESKDDKFPVINYTMQDIGTHYYKITEEIPAEDERNGFIYDDTEIKIQVEVKDKEDGTLSATILADENGKTPEIKFTNDYDAEGSITLTAKKTINNKDIAEGEFEFEVYEYTDSTRSAKKNAEPVSIGKTKAATVDSRTGKATAEVVFDEITYSYKAGDAGYHYYKVFEKNAGKTIDGVAYTTTGYNISVQVLNTADGTLKAARTSVYSGYTSDMTFTNTYTASGDAELIVTKELLGRELKTGEFSFVADITKTNANGITTTIATSESIGTNDANGKIKLGATYTAADIGSTYKYVIKEVVPSTSSASYKKGVTYSVKNITATVKVTDAGKGVLNTEVTYSETNPTITNLYNAKGDVTFTASKLLKGRTIADKQFEFGIYEGTTLVAKGTNDADGKIVFEKIEYAIDSTGATVVDETGVHNYTIKEIIPATKEPGYIYDTKEYPVKVTVSDNGDGTLKVVVDTSNAKLDQSGLVYTVNVAVGRDANFVNEYGAKGTLSLVGTKTLNGRALNNEEFNFKAVEYKVDGDTKTATGRTFYGTNDTTGKITFDKIEYSKNATEDWTGAYSYTVTEQIPTVGLSGVTYDTTSYEITTNVTDNGDGTLEVSRTDSVAAIAYTNEYDAQIEFTLKATKSLDSKDLRDEQFEFTMYDESNNAVATGKNDADGNIEFTSLEYYIHSTENNLGTYKYKIVETDGGVSGYTYDVAPYEVTVKAEDSGDGKIVLTVDGAVKKAADSTDEKEVYDLTLQADKTENFMNKYAAKGEITFAGTKTMPGKTTTNTREIIEDEFKFEVTEYEDDTYTTVLTDEDDEPMTWVVTNLADGTIQYPTINYVRNAEKDDVGTHYYKVTEVTGTAGGVTYSEQSYDVIVEVSDNDDGTLEVTPSENSTSLDFENTYEATGSILFGVKKSAIDAANTAYNDIDDTGKANGSVFYFDLFEGENLIETVSTGVNGAVEFSEIVYDLDDVGDHTYVIKEKSEGIDLEAGYSYTDISYTVNVSVADAGDGTLTVTTEEDIPEMMFVNTYDAAGKVILKGKKSVEYLGELIKNNKLYDGEFTFIICEDTEEGTVEVSRGTNDKNGDITFDEIEYTWADRGTHTYTIYESSKDPVANIIYDTNVITVTVDVANDGEGNLVTTVKYESNGDELDTASFTNTGTSTRFKKKNEDGEYVSGAKLEILDEDGNKVVTFTSEDTEKVIYGLDMDVTYTLKEISAPKGYEIADPIKFKLNEDGKAVVNGKVVDSIEMIDAKVKSDNNVITGDSAKILFALILLISSLGCAIIVARKKKEE